MNRFLVVEFPDEKSDDGSCAAAIISSRWVQEEAGELYCYWPNFKKDSARIQSVLRHDEVAIERCSWCKINIKYQTGSFEKAKKKLKILEVQSDVECSSTDVEISRPRVPSKRYEQYVSDIDSDDECLPVMKPLKPVNSTQVIEYVPVKNLQPLSLTAPGTQVEYVEMYESDGNTISSNVAPEPLSKSFSTNSCKCERIQELVIECMKMQEKFAKQMDYVINLLQLSQANNGGDHDISFCSYTNLPLKSVQELEELNIKLFEEEDYKKMVAFLKLLGGKDGAETTRRILTKLVSNDVAMVMNWSGRGEKPAFKRLEYIIKVIVESVRSNPLAKEVSLSDVENVIKVWLRGSGDREGGRTNRKNK